MRVFARLRGSLRSPSEILVVPPSPHGLVRGGIFFDHNAFLPPPR